MINRFWSGLLMMLLLSGCGWDGTATRSPDGLVPLTSIVINGSQTIAAGTSTKFTALGFYLGVPVDITNQVAWSSASPTVADFKYTTAPNINRMTAGNTPGTAVVTATLDGVSATYTVTVSNATVTTMTITPATASVANGLTAQFEVQGVFSDTSTQDLTFDATWSVIKISDPIAASISVDPASKGLAKGLAEGSATITATFGGIATPPTATLTVTPAILQSITVATESYSIAGITKTVPFTAMANYTAGLPEDVTSKAKWVSSQTGVATIDANTGVATTVGVGTTSISATLNGISGKTNLTVQDFTLQISPSSKTLSISTANTQQMTVTVAFTGTSSTDVTSACSWISDNTAVASVTPTTGLVTAVAVSVTAANIKATYGGKSVSATIAVIQ